MEVEATDTVESAVAGLFTRSWGGRRTEFPGTCLRSDRCRVGWSGTGLQPARSARDERIDHEFVEGLPAVTTSIRLPRSAGLCLIIAVVLALLAVAVLPGTDAGAVSGTAGPINVTVTPTSGLTDGQVITITAAMTEGTLAEIRTHICMLGTGEVLFPNDTFDFGFQGPYCSKVAPGSGDFQTFQAFAPGTTSGSLTFKAGIGTASWTDEDPTPGQHDHTLTCDSSHPCELVTQFQNTAGTSQTQYFTAELTYAGATTTTGDGTTTTSTSTTSDRPRRRRARRRAPAARRPPRRPRLRRRPRRPRSGRDDHDHARRHDDHRRG